MPLNKETKPNLITLFNYIHKHEGWREPKDILRNISKIREAAALTAISSVSEYEPQDDLSSTARKLNQKGCKWSVDPGERGK